MTKTIFWFLIGIAVAICIMLLGTALNISNPGVCLSYVLVAAAALTGGYILGRKSDKN